MQASIDVRVQQEEWKAAAINTGTFSELQLALGNIKAATISSQHSIVYAERSWDYFQCIAKRTTHANALHQSGEAEQALKLFNKAEQLHKKFRPAAYLYLDSLQGFHYCDLLLAEGKVAEVLKRAEYALEISITYFGLLSIALYQLALGRAYWQQGHFPQATDWLDQAVAGLHEAGDQDMLPLGLLARAAMCRDTRNPNHDFTRARQDLKEVLDIAEPSGMRLHLTDYHLEMARLLIAEQENPPQAPVEKGESAEDSPQEHIAKAAKLIEETGYKRRLPELEALQMKVAGLM